MLQKKLQTIFNGFIVTVIGMLLLSPFALTLAHRFWLQ